jgi:glycosyltransferase involved in cell wall biosynthesis
MKVIVLTTSYNCEDYIERSLSTIMTQTYKNFKCYITDDMSTDGTVEKIKNFIKGDDRFVLIENKTKLYQSGNYDQVIRGEYDIDGEDICIEVDGDDWLPDSRVFERVVETYNGGDIWLLNGSFRYHDGRPGFSQPHTTFEDIRQKPFTLSHLRTWKVFLWRSINPEDLKDSEGNNWKIACDLAFMFPMVEMCGPEHYKFMYDINYIYNESNPLNEHKVNLNEVQRMNHIIRAFKPYEKLIR